MKKNKFYLFLISISYLLFQNTQAQEISATIGNPNSTNTLFITHTTGITNTYFDPSIENTITLPDSHGVEVTPPSNQIPLNAESEILPDSSELQPLGINETINIE